MKQPTLKYRVQNLEIAFDKMQFQAKIQTAIGVYLAMLMTGGFVTVLLNFLK